MSILDWILGSNKEKGPTSSQLERRVRPSVSPIDKLPEKYDDTPLEGGPVFRDGRWSNTVGELKDNEYKSYCESLSTQTMD